MKINVTALKELDSFIVTTENEHLQAVFGDDSEVSLTLKVPSTGDVRAAHLLANAEDKYSHRMFNDAIYLGLILEWTGFTDNDGNVLPCNTEMKELLLNRVDGFITAIDKIISEKRESSNEAKKKELSDKLLKK